MDQSPPSKRPLPWPLWVAMGIALVALLLRLHGLTRAVVWYDEAFGLLVARLPWADLLDPLATNRQAPLWFWLLSMWGVEPVVWARLLGVLTGVVTVLALMPLHRRLGWRVTLIAMALLAVHPVHVHQSQEIRMYALVVLFIVVALQLAMGQARGGSRLGWVLLALSAWAAMLTQWLAGMVLAGMWLGMIVARRKSMDRRWLIGWLGSGAAAVIGVLPWLLRVERGTVFSSSDGGHPLLQMLEGSLGHIRQGPLLRPMEDQLTWSLFLVATMLGLLLVGLGNLRRSEAHRPEAAVLGWTFFLGLALMGAYQLAGFVFYTRYLIVLLVPGLLLVAASFRRIHWGWVLIVGGFLVWGLGSNSVAVGRANGHAREVTGRMTQMVEVLGRNQEIPPMLCTARFLGFSIRASLPEHDIRLMDSTALTESERFVFGPERVVSQWPEQWEGPVWVLVSGWGQMPSDQSEVARQAVEAVEKLEGDRHVGRIHPPLMILGGVKWAFVVVME